MMGKGRHGDADRIHLSQEIRWAVKRDSVAGLSHMPGRLGMRINDPNGLPSGNFAKFRALWCRDVPRRSFPREWHSCSTSSFATSSLLTGSRLLHEIEQFVNQFRGRYGRLNFQSCLFIGETSSEQNSVSFTKTENILAFKAITPQAHKIHLSRLGGKSLVEHEWRDIGTNATHRSDECIPSDCGPLMNAYHPREDDGILDVGMSADLGSIGDDDAVADVAIVVTCTIDIRKFPEPMRVIPNSLVVGGGRYKLREKCFGRQ